jgi:hypothetical protein
MSLSADERIARLVERAAAVEAGRELAQRPELADKLREQAEALAECLGKIDDLEAVVASAYTASGAPVPAEIAPKRVHLEVLRGGLAS